MESSEQGNYTVNRIALILALLVGIALISFACLRTHQAGIEQDIKERVTAALTNEGITAELTMDGRDVIFSDLGGDDATKQKAIQLSGAVYGVNRVSFIAADAVATEVVNTQALHKPRLVIRFVDDEVILEGEVATEKLKARLGESMDAIYGTGRVKNQLVATSAVSEAAWLEDIPAFAGQFAASGGEVLMLEEDVLFLQGSSADAATKQALIEKAKAIVGGTTKVKDQLALVETSANLQIALEKNEITLDGLLRAQPSLDLVRNALEIYHPDHRITSSVQIDSQVAKPAWVKSAVSIIKLFSDFDQMTLVFQDQRLVMTGAINDDASKSVLEERIRQLLPKDFVIDNQMIVAFKAPANAQQQKRAEARRKLSTLELTQINFQRGSAELQASSDAVLDDIVAILLDYPSVRVDVVGHTDSNGSAELNQKLSLQRAQAVRRYLIAKGVKAKRLKAVGFGASRPLASNATSVGRAKNRRIEFKF